jgi:hypothetical protein
MADRPALHENDRVVPVLAGHGRRQAKDIPGLRSPDQLLEARRRQVMAFVHDQMTVFPDAVIDYAGADEALDQRHVERAVRLVAAAADAADGPGRQTQEGCQPFDPLLPAVAGGARAPSVLTPRRAISHAATTVLPKAVVAARTPWS